MFGFDIIVNGRAIDKTADIQFENICCTNRMIKKFENDRLFEETNEYIIILDGVILNRERLIKDFNKEWNEVIVSLYVKYGETFFSVLRGSFAGALYDKSKKKWIVFSDQLGTRFTYYSHVGDFFCVTEEMGHIYDILNVNNIKYTLSTNGVWLLLSYGFMAEDKTLCNEVSKIQPGCYIVFENNKVTEKRYFMLDNTPDESITEDEAIERVDLLFRQAVIRQFEKDNEYGYKHFVALSSGLDSRMTTVVAHECGYQHQLNFTFSQTDFWDEKTPKKIAEDYFHEWIFKSLDGGMWMFDVDRITKLTGGNVAYYGTAHGESLYRYVNFSELGLMHSGQLGDVILGTTVLPEKAESSFVFGEGAMFKANITNFEFKPAMEVNKEIGLFYYRYLNGTNNGLQNVYKYTDSLSPFMDLDFVTYVLKIPAAMRYDHRLYKKWILSKYPKAANYVWDKLDGKITDKFWTKMIPIGNYSIRMKNLYKLPNIFYQKLFHPNEPHKYKRAHMNPIGYYLKINPELIEMVDTYKPYCNSICDDKQRIFVEKVMSGNDANQIFQAISLLSALKLYYAK